MQRAESQPPAFMHAKWSAEMDTWQITQVCTHKQGAKHQKQMAAGATLCSFAAYVSVNDEQLPSLTKKRRMQHTLKNTTAHDRKRSCMGTVAKSACFVQPG